MLCSHISVWTIIFRPLVGLYYYYRCILLPVVFCQIMIKLRVCVHRATSESGATALVYKSAKRKELVEAGYRILGNTGDQWSDLFGTYVGNRTFKVPDPMYYISWSLWKCSVSSVIVVLSLYNPGHCNGSNFSKPKGANKELILNLFDLSSAWFFNWWVFFFFDQRKAIHSSSEGKRFSSQCTETNQNY